MSIIIWWIIFGGLVGLIAGAISGGGGGILVDVLLGIIGSWLGSWIFGFFGQPGVTGFNLYSFLVAIIGALILIGIGRALR